MKYFLGGENSTMHVVRRVGRLREREWYPCGSLNHFDGAFLPGFFWLSVFSCLVQSPYLVYLSVLLCVCAHQ